MFKRINYLLIGIALVIFTGCSEEFIDPQRNTNNLTSESIAEAAENNPDLIKGTLDGIVGFMADDQSIAPGRHYDFGQKGVDIWLDITAGDMALSASSFGWYNSTANLVTQTDFSQEENQIIWDYYYKTVGLANAVISNLGGEDAAPENRENQIVLAQAKAYRGYAYFYLTQIFQNDYDPAEPILPFYTSDETITEKVPASQVFDLIVSDLTYAVETLEGYERGIKSQVDQTVARGLLAYTYAAMGNYQDAKTQSDAVISSGYPLTTRGELAFPGAGSGFNTLSSPSWIWGFDLTEQLGHQLIDWWGQIDYFTFSYAWAGDSKSMDDNLFSEIPDNDIRKDQWGQGFAPLQPINKFFAPGRTPGAQQVITTDLIWMRVEEFYLLSAEAAAKTGNEAEARSLLVDLLEIRFDSTADANNYVSNLSGQQLIDEILLQTRIEMWGEGKSYLAIKRNDATITRGSNHVFRPGETFSASDEELSFEIPQTEIDNNPSINSQN